MGSIARHGMDELARPDKPSCTGCYLEENPEVAIGRCLCGDTRVVKKKGVENSLVGCYHLIWDHSFPLSFIFHFFSELLEDAKFPPNPKCTYVPFHTHTHTHTQSGRRLRYKSGIRATIQLKPQTVQPTITLLITMLTSN